MRKNNPIYKRALMLAVPMMIQNGITNMVSLVDNIMMGSQGTEAMTAVSIAGQLIFVFNLAIFGALAGPGIYGAQYYGQRNLYGFQSTFRIKLWLSAACLIGGLLVFLLGDETLIGLYLHGESATVDAALTMTYAKQYLHIMLIGLPFFVVTQVYATSLRETGSSVKPMVGGVASVVVDVVLNYLLIYGNCGMPKLGVRGAAIATVLARVAEMSIVVIWAHLCRNKHTFLKGIYRTLLVPGTLAKKVIRKGMPIFCNELLWSARVGGADAVLFHPWAGSGGRTEHFQRHLQSAQCGICGAGFCGGHSHRADAGRIGIRACQKGFVQSDVVHRRRLSAAGGDPDLRFRRVPQSL